MVSSSSGGVLLGGGGPSVPSERRPDPGRYGGSRIEAAPRAASSQTKAASMQANQQTSTTIDLISHRFPAATYLYLLLVALAVAQHSPPVWLGAGAQAQQPSKQPTTSVPYKTYYVTSACEWKSNLFVPKSNDILFAQPAFHLPGSGSGAGAGGSELQQVAEQEPQQLAADTSRTILSTESEALILALPLMMGHSFAGYEQACSIRLIVPRNMRILAKLMSRRFSLAQQSEPSSTAVSGQFLDQGQSLWVNVSQNQFAETEHWVLATEGNVIAFRFLLERFANRLAPDARFQVLVTAFKALSENSSPDQQLICDRERIISTSLACDGFRNCQDGSDEEPATCLALRATLPADKNQRPGSSLLNPTPTQDSSPMKQTERHSFWSSVWLILTGGERTILGLLLSFLLLVLLLVCCVCHFYLCVLFVRRYWNRQRHQSRSGRLTPLSTTAEQRTAAAIRQATEQNEQNLARQKRILSGSASAATPPPVLQSILKKPSSESRLIIEGPFRPQVSASQILKQPQQQQQRGALQSSLIKGGSVSSRHIIPAHLSQPIPSQQTGPPTPAKRGVVRPTRTPPLPISPPQYLSHNNPLPSTTSPHPLDRPPAPPRHRQPISSGATKNTTSNITTGTQRITTYHYSSGSMHMSDNYLERLVAESNQRKRTSPNSQPGKPTSNSQQSNQQSSLI